MSARRYSHDIALLDTLAGLSVEPFVGEFWRIVHGLRSPLDGSKGAGRWNLRESEVLYCALERDGALSEIHFHISRQQSVFPSKISSVAHNMRATFDRTIDLTDLNLLARMGVETTRYKEILYENTQKIGEAVCFLGFEAMLVPNARHKSNNLVIFPTNCDLDTIVSVRKENIDWNNWRESH